LVLASLAGAALAFPKPKYPVRPEDVSSAPSESASPHRTSPTESPTPQPPQQQAYRPAAPLPHAPAGTLTYTVARGDTLTGVGRRFAVGVGRIAQVNGLDPAAGLATGLKLRLPPGARDGGKDPYAQGPVSVSQVSGGQVSGGQTSSGQASSRQASGGQVSSRQVSGGPVSGAQVSGAQVSAGAYAGGGASAEAPTAPAKPQIRLAQGSAAPLVLIPGPAKPQPQPNRSTAAGLRPPLPATTGTPASSPTSTTLTASTASTTAATPAGPPTPAAGYPNASEVAALGRGKFVWPVKGDVLSGFNPKRTDLGNDGLNIEAQAGTSVRAAAAGYVVYTGDYPGFGNLVLVKHPDGWVTAYGHLQSIEVHMRDHVAQGQELGQVGHTGGVTLPQLHFEIRYAPSPKEKARPVDPDLVLPQ
jgi:murein DD-endopeptidase MepM/ murein hydrolase activator NlpD